MKTPGVFDQYNQRTLRERVVLLVGAIIVVSALASLFFFQPWLRDTDRLNRQRAALQADVHESETAEQLILARSEEDPDKENRAQLEALQVELDLLQQQFETGVVNLVSPSEMPALLKNLLTQQKALQLLDLENLPPERLKLSEEDADESNAPKLYRHRLRMKFSGDYLTMLKYLKQLRKLSPQLVWESVAVESQEYPETTVLFQVYTLSVEEGWIGG